MKTCRRRRWLGAAGLIAGGAWALGYWIVPALLPFPDGLSSPEAFAPGITYTDRHGRALRRLLTEDELRIDLPASLAEIPDSLALATLAAEDARFRSHGGVDFLGLGRAARDAVGRGRVMSGGSTVTQQLVKISSPPRRRTLSAKIREIFLARRVEMSWEKDAILEAYLNRLPYGNQFTGCRAAARGYFAKPLGDLSLAESALLAALPNKPTRYNPWRNLDRARVRQRWILGRMLELRWISQADHDAAWSESLRLSPRGPGGEFEAPHFIELVRLNEEQTRLPLARTSLDLELQRFVEKTVAAQLQALDHQIGRRLSTQGAALVIDNATGEVLALAGSRDFHGSAAGQINGAWTPRSPGSALKPFTYVLALDRGGRLASEVLPDLPVEYATPTGAYRPVNFDRRFRGPVTLRHALANSLNVPAVRLLESLGGPEPLHTLLTGPLGFTGLDPDPMAYGLGLTLGNAEVRLLELASAYACVARLGVALPWRVHPAEAPPAGKVVFSREACWIVADILSDNMARAEAFGLDSPLRLPFRAAAKTGTSTDYRDNWALGFTPRYTVGAWVGHFGNAPLQNISGVSGAGPIFHAILAELHREEEAGWYPLPESLAEAEIDALNGKRFDPAVLGFRPRQVSREWFPRERLPPLASPEDYDEAGRTLLPAAYAAWLEGPGSHLAGAASATLAEDAAGGPRLRIVSPLPGTVAYLDPDLPGGGRRFPLRAESRGVAGLEWGSDTLQVEVDDATGKAWLLLEPGTHRVTVRDLASGAADTVEIAVESL